MKRIFILFVSLVFIVSMTACQSAIVQTGMAGTPDAVSPADTVDTELPETALQTAASGGSYTLTLDVNPSIELTVQGGLVTAAAAYNDDGQAILLNANVSGLSVNDSIDAIIAEIAAAGYLDAADKEPYVLLTMAGGEMDPELYEELKEYTEKALEDAGVDCEVKSVPISGDIVDGAAAQGLSAGRYMMLQYIAKEKGISFEEAVAIYGTMSIGQLMEQFDDIEEAFDEDGENDIEDIDDEDGENDIENIDDEDADDQDEENIEDENSDEDDDQASDQNNDHDDDDHDEHGGEDDEGEDD